ncbi:MAG TPA: Do family serine endopeptidase [Bacteroidales bacterium]|nr:Do family serine endopeptidase [Bacteroidales bacterium]
MKGKNLFAGLLMAVLGAVIALFAYTRFIEKAPAEVMRDTSGIDTGKAQAYMTSLQQRPGQIDFTFAAEQTVHAVVHVRTKSMMGSQPQNPIMEFFYGPQYQQKPREVRGYGSGVIISSDGYIITNNHVIEDAEDVEIALNDRRIFPAEVIGRDPATDLALLKVKGENFPFIKYGNSDELKVGEWVLAVGNPFNLTSTVTAGIVSAKGRSLGLNQGDYSIESFIQTDAALNMGNSGGALVDTNGNLVGITSAILSPSGAYAGNSFAIPVSIVKKVVEDLREYGAVQRALIGVNIRDVDYEDAEKFKLDGVRGILITNVVEKGAAEAAGLKENDVIIALDGQPVNSVGELQDHVGRHRPGDKASITYIRNGKENNASLVLKNASGTTEVVKYEAGSDIVYGAKLEPISASDKKKYDIDYGVKVTDPGDGKFGDLGMQKGFIILSINGKRVEKPSDVRQYSANESNLRSIGGIQPDGTILNYQFGN